MCILYMTSTYWHFQNSFGFCGQLSHPWSVHLDVDRSWSVLKRNFCNFNLFWRLLTFSDNCANLTFFHFHNSVGDCTPFQETTSWRYSSLFAGRNPFLLVAIHFWCIALRAEPFDHTIIREEKPKLCAHFALVDPGSKILPIFHYFGGITWRTYDHQGS